MEPLIHLNYPLKVDLLLMEADEARKIAIPHADSRYDEQYEEWLKSKWSSPTVQQMMKDFGVCGKPRFYFQAPHYQVAEHTDNGTLCSLNFVLSDDAAPVTIESKDYFYSQCLLNTTIPHSIKNGSSERILLKISIVDKTFEELAKTLPYKK